MVESKSSPISIPFSSVRAKKSKGLRLFLCHSSTDKPHVRGLYDLLVNDGCSPWLDEKDILPGQDWELEIQRALRNADVILICLSAKAVRKEGYVQKEIKIALDIAAEKPDGTIFIVPVRFDDCDVPARLR